MQPGACRPENQSEEKHNVKKILVLLTIVAVVGLFGYIAVADGGKCAAPKTGEARDAAGCCAARTDEAKAACTATPADKVACASTCSAAGASVVTTGDMGKCCAAGAAVVTAGDKGNACPMGADGKCDPSKCNLMLCGKCGEFKGSGKCCSADATICEKCGLHAGSLGCCKIEKGTDVAICKCGEIKGSENCCKEGVALCPACGLHAGSPGCQACCAAKETNKAKEAKVTA
jgi:hypothetical protein